MIPVVELGLIVAPPLTVPYLPLLRPTHLLPPTDHTIDRLRKSQDFTIISWGPQHRVIGQRLGLGNMWLSSCGFWGLGFLAKVNSAICMCVGTLVPNWNYSANIPPTLWHFRNLLSQELRIQKFRKMIATCFLGPMFALEPDVEVPRT